MQIKKLLLLFFLCLSTFTYASNSYLTFTLIGNFSVKKPELQQINQSSKLIFEGNHFHIYTDKQILKYSKGLNTKIKKLKQQP